MKLMIAAISAALLCASLAACNTVKGIGQDVKAAGEKIEDAAAKQK